MTQNDRIRLVWPEIPSIERWTPYLQASYAQNWHTNTGPAALQLESQLEHLCGRPPEKALVMSSATAGLSACLIAHGIKGPVICPSFTFQATPGAILGAGCHPVIVDVGPEDGIVTAQTLAQALEETGAKAAMLVVPYGIEANFSDHAEICKKAGVRLVLDNAAGLSPDRKACASNAPAVHVDEVFSLHATKVFGIGEGGAVFTAKEHETALRSAINFGLNTHTAAGAPVHPHWGINGKMSEAMAAIGLAVADEFESRVTRRRTMAQKWIDALRDTPARIFCKEAQSAPWQVFPIQLRNDATVTEFVVRMDAEGIETRRYYKPSLGDCAGMISLGPCPNARDLADRAIVLPMRSWMTAADHADLMNRTVAILKSLPD